MTSADIVRLIDSIARDKEIDKEGLFQAIEQAVAQAIARKYGVDDLELKLNRGNGQWICNYEISLEEQGRIMAQAVKQTILGKVREAERDVLYQEYERKLGEIASGTVQRFEGGSVIVNLGRNMEGILPQAEKVRTENYNIGDRIRALVLEVKKVGPRVKVILSRAHRDLVRALFELEVPEIADGTIVIRRIEREPGYRTKLAVHSADPKVDCVGACVGVRGTRIKSIIDELNNERIDIIRWNDDPQTLITNALKPAEISHIELDHENRKALVLVGEEQLSLAIGRKGQNVRLASKLTGWEIDIMTRAELEKSVADEDAAAAAEPGDEQGEAEDQEAAAGEQAVAEPAAEEPVGAAPAGAEPPAEEPIAQEPARAASGAASGSSGAAAGKASDAPGRTQDDENTAGSVAQS
jgi:N utilization substance protein A